MADPVEMMIDEEQLYSHFKLIGFTVKYIGFDSGCSATRVQPFILFLIFFLLRLAF